MKVWLAAVAIAATIGTPAVAQVTETSTGSRLARPMMLGKDGTNQRVLLKQQWEVARCVVRKQPRLAGRVVNASNDLGVDLQRAGVREDNLVAGLSIKTCMEESPDVAGDIVWVVAQPLLHSMLVGPLYAATFTSAPMRNWKRVQALPPANYGAADAQARLAAGGVFSECLARVDFGGADALTRAEPYTPAEDAAIATLKPAMAECLEKGSTVTLRRDMLRRMVTEATWRLANGTDLAPTPAPAKTNG